MTLRNDAAWPMVALSDILSRITYGFTNPMPTASSGPYMVTAKDIHDGRIDYRTTRRTSQAAYRSLLTDKSRPRIGDVLLTKDGSIGRVAVCDRDDVCINQSVALLQPTDKVVPDFLAYLLQTPHYQAQMDADADGSTIKHIYITRVDKMLIPLPPIAEQRAVVAVLGVLDDKIAVNERILAAVDQLARSLLDEALGRTGSSATKLGKIAQVNARKVNPVPDGYLRYIDISSVSLGNVAWPERIRWSLAPGRARRGVVVGDTIWSTVRPGRRSYALILDSDPEIVVSTGFAVLTPVHVGYAFLYEVTKRDDFVQYLESVAEGSAYPAVRAERFEQAIIPLPSRSPLDRFEAIASKLRQRANAAHRESRRLAELRNTLLPLLMSGEIRVREAEEPAEDAT